MAHLSRRKLIVSGATLAAAGVATGALVTTSVHATSPVAGAAVEPGAPTPDEPVVVHLRDVQNGQLELFVGTRHVSFTDPAMAAALARTAATAG